jgi:hypothetical protein
VEPLGQFVAGQAGFQGVADPIGELFAGRRVFGDDVGGDCFAPGGVGFAADQRPLTPGTAAMASSTSRG